MNINPTIAITGANGKIRSNLTEELRKLNLNFIKLNQLELIDETAIELNLDGRHIDTIIDLGWDTKNRGTLFQNKCARKSINLSKYCHKNNIKYIFLSSYTAINPKKSQYGIAKKFVELQLNKDMTALRAPFVISSKDIELNHSENLYGWKVFVPYIVIGDLVKAIVDQLSSDVLNETINLDYKVIELKEVYPVIKIFRIFNYVTSISIVIFFLSPFKKIEFIGNTLDRLYGLIEVDQMLKNSGGVFRDKL